MRILIPCEFSGIVWKTFTDKGHDVTSCDLLPSELSTKHYQGDVRDILYQEWDMIIAFPPCTYLANSGVRWLSKQSDPLNARYKRMIIACNFFNLFLNHPCQKICVENPIQHGYAREDIRKYDQIIQPWQFGHEVQKSTCLWLKGLPPLKPTKIVDRGMIYVDPRGIKHGGEFTMRAKKCYSPLMLIPGGTKDRWKIRSRTFKGIAEAMASQWG